MISQEADLLAWVQERVWFYQFELPGGGVTRSDPIEEVLRLHETRRQVMRHVLEREFGSDLSNADAIDLASHEGWFSLDLARRMRRVRGYDINATSVEAATKMMSLQQVVNATFAAQDIRDLDRHPAEAADFVLMFGLLYHVEDPIRILRIAASLTRKVLLIETQVSGVDLSMNVEFGNYRWLRPVQGMFALIDDDDNREGGNTGLALIPSPGALRHILHRLGFTRVEQVQFSQDDTEQLARRTRVIMLAVR